MNVECFLDTNVLIYAAAGRDDEEQKRLRALQLIESTDFGLSAQVLQEFYVVVTRKIKHRLTPDRALEWIEQWEAFPCVSIDSITCYEGTACTALFRRERPGAR